jgi:hypothetical protein
LHLFFWRFWLSLAPLQEAKHWLAQTLCVALHFLPARAPPPIRSARFVEAITLIL